MAEQLKTLVALAKDSGTLTVLTMTHSSSFRISDAFFWLLGAPGTYVVCKQTFRQNT